MKSIAGPARSSYAPRPCHRKTRLRRSAAANVRQLSQSARTTTKHWPSVWRWGTRTTTADRRPLPGRGYGRPAGAHCASAECSVSMSAEILARGRPGSRILGGSAPDYLTVNSPTLFSLDVPVWRRRVQLRRDPDLLQGPRRCHGRRLPPPRRSSHRQCSRKPFDWFR